MNQTTTRSDGLHEAEADTEGDLDRRELFRLLGGRAALAGLGALLPACKVTDAPTDLATRMLQRLTWGINSASKEHMDSVGPVQWLEEQLAMGQAESMALSSTLLATYPTIDYTVVDDPGSSADFKSHYDLVGPQGLEEAVALLINYGGQVAPAALTRAVSSDAQLYERMVDFWNDHFNVSQFDVLFHWKTVYENTAIRPHALGTFRDLLKETAQSVAMLKYLNNERNRVGEVNENYARELLELHTVGVDGSYSEADIREAANLLTGWGVEPLEAGGPGWGWESRYIAGDQATFSLPIFGWNNPGNATGESAIVAFLDHLAGHPATKTYVCRKLIARFISEETSGYTSLLDDMVAAWGTDGDIKAVLRAMIKVNSGAASPLVSAPPKFQRPFDYTAACFRALGLQVHYPWAGGSGTPQGLPFAKEVLFGMGQTPHAWPSPDGYPDTEEDWLNPAMFDFRWRLVEKLVASIDTQATGPYPESVSVENPWMQLHVLARIGGSGDASDGFPVVETYQWLFATLIGGEATADGLAILENYTGWTNDYVPTEAELKAKFPGLLMIVLASRDKQYR